MAEESKNAEDGARMEPERLSVRARGREGESVCVCVCVCVCVKKSVGACMLADAETHDTSKTIASHNYMRARAGTSTHIRMLAHIAASWDGLEIQFVNHRGARTRRQGREWRRGRGRSQDTSTKTLRKWHTGRPMESRESTASAANPSSPTRESPRAAPKHE